MTIAMDRQKPMSEAKMGQSVMNDALLVGLCLCALPAIIIVWLAAAVICLFDFARGEV